MSHNDNRADDWLRSFVQRHAGVAGTVHRNRDDVLELVSAFNIPEPVQRIVAHVPRGKGMAGLALERNRPVATCNLKTDSSGDVQPGARAVAAQAGVAIPVHDERGGVRAVVGIAYAEERDLDEAELDALAAAARTLPSLA